jgi:hypothetical protein
MLSPKIMISYFIFLENNKYIIYNIYSVFKGVVKLARIINQNKEVIATKNKEKATVSKTSLIVGVALSIAAIVVLVVIILFLTKKNNENNESNTTPLLQYIENYEGKNKNENKIKLISGFDVKYEMEKFSGECYILVYDTSWMKENDKDSAIYKAYEVMDSYLTGSKRSDGKEMKSDPLLKAIENCGKDVRFFVVDFNSVKKSDDDAQKNPVYFTMSNGTAFSNIQAPMFFHYKNDETYSSMNDSKLLLADGSVDKNGKANYSAARWGSIIISQVNYLNSLDNDEQD